jgi:hypothetical protein
MEWDTDRLLQYFHSPAQRPYGLHPGHRHVLPRFPLREIGGTDMATLAINKGRHSAKAGNWRRAKRARRSSIFPSRHPSPPTNRNGGMGSKSREKVQSLSFQPSFWREGVYRCEQAARMDCIALASFTHTRGRSHHEWHESHGLQTFRNQDVSSCLFPTRFGGLDCSSVPACHTPPANGTGRPTGVLATPARQ